MAQLHVCVRTLYSRSVWAVQLFALPPVLLLKEAKKAAAPKLMCLCAHTLSISLALKVQEVIDTAGFNANKGCNAAVVLSMS